MHDSMSLVPHAICWKGDPRLIWTMAITSAITFVSYLSICIALLSLARRTRRVLVREWAFFVVGFALFIVACGTTHLMDVVTTWIPIFWVGAWASICTAALSACVAVVFFRRKGAIAFGINDYAARLANAELEKTQLEASLLTAHKLEEWGRISATVSHEIANPLETVQNLLYLIRNTAGVPPEAIEHANLAAIETERAVTIARSALDFLRHSSKPTSIDLGQAAESVRLLLDRHLREKQLTLEICTHVVEHGDGANFIVEARPGEARQVLLNLIRNAVEATAAYGAPIHVGLTSYATRVEVVVSDSGAGIDPAVLPSLFQFGRSTKGEEGNGMGLWTVKHIVTRHGGILHVESKPGQGTKFVLSWPRHYGGTAELEMRLSNPAQDLHSAAK